MAEKKANLLEKAKELGLEIDHKSKVADIKQAIELAEASKELDIEKAAAEPPEKEVSSPHLERVEPLTDEGFTTKSGKRSPKGQKESAEKAEKIAKQDKETGTEPEEHKAKPKPRPTARSRIERRGKKYREAAKLIEPGKVYSIDEAVGLAQKTSPVKFDASLEVHLNLGVDPRLADQNIRGTVVLPHGTGKSVRIAVFGSDDDVKAAKAAGADIAAGDEFLEMLKKEELNFDVLIATPDMMPKLGPHAKLLGPKGLMPNPKSGTVTKEVARAVKDAKAGKVEFRVDKQGIIHAAVGKVSFGSADLADNAKALVRAVKDARPPSVKGVYLESAWLTTTMGPSIKLDLKNL